MSERTIRKLYRTRDGSGVGLRHLNRAASGELSLTWTEMIWRKRRIHVLNCCFRTKHNCRSLHSSASSRPSCSSTRQQWVWLGCLIVKMPKMEYVVTVVQLWVSCTIVRRCCDYTASSAPTTNGQTRLDSKRLLRVCNVVSNFQIRRNIQA